MATVCRSGRCAVGSHFFGSRSFLRDISCSSEYSPTFYRLWTTTHLSLPPTRPRPYGVARLGYVIAVTPLMIVVSPDVREREGPKVLFQTLCHRGKSDGWEEHCFQRRGRNNTSAGSFNQFFMLIWWTVFFTLTIGPYELGKFFPLGALAIQRIRSPSHTPSPPHLSTYGIPLSDTLWDRLM